MPLGVDDLKNLLRPGAAPGKANKLPAKRGRNKGAKVFADIRQVDVREAHGTFNLIFEFHDARRTFLANVGTKARGTQALSLLPQSVPLSGRAREALLPTGAKAGA